MVSGYTINREEGIVYVTFEGRIVIEELVDFIKEVQKDPEVKKGMNAFVDITRAVLDWNYLEITQLRNYIKAVVDEIYGEVKWAVLANDPPALLTANLVGMLGAAIGTKVTIKGFPAREEAIQWLKTR